MKFLFDAIRFSVWEHILSTPGFLAALARLQKPLLGLRPAAEHARQHKRLNGSLKRRRRVGA